MAREFDEDNQPAPVVVNNGNGGIGSVGVSNGLDHQTRSGCSRAVTMMTCHMVWWLTRPAIDRPCIARARVRAIARQMRFSRNQNT